MYKTIKIIPIHSVIHLQGSFELKRSLHVYYIVHIIAMFKLITYLLFLQSLTCSCNIGFHKFTTKRPDTGPMSLACIFV